MFVVSKVYHWLYYSRELIESRGAAGASTVLGNLSFLTENFRILHTYIRIISNWKQSRLPVDFILVRQLVDLLLRRLLQVRADVASCFLIIDR